MKRKKKDAKDIIAELLLSYGDVQRILNITHNPESKMLDLLTQYIEHHKWLVNEKIPYPISIEQAFFSWYENVFYPQFIAMEATGVFKAFKKTPAFRLFDEISEIHYKEVDASKHYVPYEVACYVYIRRYARSWFARWRANRALRYYDTQN